MKNFIQKIKLYAISHKIISAIVVIVALSGGYWVHAKITNTSGETRYVLAPAAMNTVISSITGTGQVSALNQINIQPQVSGVLTYVGATPGEYVGTGQVLFNIDDTDAQKTVRDAEITLESAQNSLAKLQIQDSTDNLNATLAQAYDDGFNSVSNAFLDLPGIMTGLENMFFKPIGAADQWGINWYAAQVATSDQDEAALLGQNLTDSYNAALTAYNANFESYKSTARTADNTTLDALISQTYQTTELISDAEKDANNYIDFVNNSMQTNNFTIPAVIGENQASLNTYISKTNTDLSSVLASQTEIQNDTQAFQDSTLDLQASQLSVQQAQNALGDAKDDLAYYSIPAPFSGIIASVPVVEDDNVGSGTTLATLITSEQIAVISLNEVDVAKIQLGDKATLTFDAVPNLTITGEVTEIDSVGTVSQGVVDYNVQISFDIGNASIRPGMSVNAAIITNVAQNILTVPNGAIKTQGNLTYVQMFAAPLPAPLPGVQGSPSSVPPIEQPVTVGVSDDTNTEIISGLKAGDEVVTRTITPTTTSATTAAAPSILGSSAGRGGGGAVRIP